MSKYTKNGNLIYNRPSYKCVSLAELQPGTDWSATDAPPARVLPPVRRLFASPVPKWVHAFGLREGEETFKDATSIYQAANEMSSTFPNIKIIFKKSLTLPISNASGERSFSALKRAKYYRRNTMTENSKIDTTRTIDDFARKKSRETFI